MSLTTLPQKRWSEVAFEDLITGLSKTAVPKVKVDENSIGSFELVGADVLTIAAGVDPPPHFSVTTVANHVCAAIVRTFITSVTVTGATLGQQAVVDNPLLPLLLEVFVFSTTRVDIYGRNPSPVNSYTVLTGTTFNVALL